MPHKDPEKHRAAMAAYSKSAKGKARAAVGHKRYYAKPEKRAKMLADNKRWHEKNKRVRYPREIEELNTLLKTLKRKLGPT